MLLWSSRMWITFPKSNPRLAKNQKNMSQVKKNMMTKIIVLFFLWQETMCCD